MMWHEGGFYSALDADSEGEEGKFYVWEKAEVDSVLGDDAAMFCAYYDVTAKGNWEGKNILHVPIPAISADQSNEEAEILMNKLAACRKKLLLQRGKRARPLLDDKMLLGWNALMNTACSKAYAATGEERYRQLAVKNMRFITDHFSGKSRGAFYHTFKNGLAGHDAFLDDYAYLIQALIHLQEITGNASYLELAREITEFVTEGFADAESDFFFFTHRSQQDVILRKKEIYDSAVPSGNSVMAGNLLYLSHVFDNSEWKKKADAMVGTLLGLIVRYPTSFGGWANQLISMTAGFKEIIITGEKFNEILFGILHIFIPARILQSSSATNEIYPLLKGKQYDDPFLIYVCENYVCQPPLTSLSSFTQQFDK